LSRCLKAKIKARQTGLTLLWSVLDPGSSRGLLQSENAVPENKVAHGANKP
jgi:hypothetical protein